MRAACRRACPTSPGFHDSAWIKADFRASAAQTWSRPERGRPTLAMSDYGLHHGDVWSRGRCTATDVKSNQLELFYGAGGAGMLQVWIDGRFVTQHELDVGRSFPETTDTIKVALGDFAPSEHVSAVMAGTNWLRTRFALDLPRGHDVQLGLTFGDATKPRSERENRVLIFVNGSNMGQFIAHLGPQRTFVIPPGILNPNGANTVALAVTTDGKAPMRLNRSSW